MKTHRILKTFFITLLLAIASPSFANTNVVSAAPVETSEAKLERLHHRLEEIKAMDRSQMSRTERKALKKEVRAIKEQVNELSGGVYISIGAILVIILLLILLL